MKIDIFPHVMPANYLEALVKKTVPASGVAEVFPWAKYNPALSDISVRLKALESTPEVAQVLTLGAPPLETVVSPTDAVELSRIANDEMAALVQKYPDKFIAAVACLPLNDVAESVKEAERAVTRLGMKGVQIFSNINGETLDSPKFWPLYELMVRYDLPLWLHPWDQPRVPRTNPLNWPFETSTAMMRLVFSGVFLDYPGIKFIVHHCGAMIPFFEQRIKWLADAFIMDRKRVADPMEDLHRFYVDTALYGGTAALMCGHAFFGSSHMLFGTDAPLGGTPSARGESLVYGHTQDTIAAIEKMDIPVLDKTKIFSENAIRLLKL